MFLFCVVQMRNRLATFGVDPYDLSIISQSGCPSHANGTEGVNINIDPETFSSHNIGQAVRKTGSAIGELYIFLLGINPVLWEQ